MPPFNFWKNMFTAKDAQLIQEVDDHGVPRTDPTDNRIEDALRRNVLDIKARYPDGQPPVQEVIEYGGTDEEYEAYAEALRKNKFDVHLEHGYRPGESERYHRFIINWHYGLTGGKLY
jgi:hypothetical protein